MTALPVAGAGGTAMCADLRALTLREEIVAVKVLGINPVPRLATPRIPACRVMQLPIVMSMSNLRRQPRLQPFRMRTGR
ncbi:ABC transporter permease [Mycobacterium paraintracellulare]|uniref:ABC transporter permease n=1 Tax=Mycobacterium paraintracellulare TaxID=1138383 RepID=UPI003B223D21